MPWKFNFYSFCFRCSKPFYIQHEMHMLRHVWIIPWNCYNMLFHIIFGFLLPWRVYELTGWVKDKKRPLAASSPLGLQPALLQQLAVILKLEPWIHVMIKQIEENGNIILGRAYTNTSSMGGFQSWLQSSSLAERRLGGTQNTFSWKKRYWHF